MGFHVGLLLLLGLELIYARRQNRLHRSVQRTAVAATTLWIAAAVAFSLYVRHTLGSTASLQYLAGYALEESLSIDNLFVFLLLFRLFAIESARQPKVLFWGVAGAIVMRGLFIAGGLSLLNRFQSVSYVFAAILLVAARPAADSGEQPAGRPASAPLDRLAEAVAPDQLPPGCVCGS